MAAGSHARVSAEQHTRVKYLITNADDFGYTHDVNEGIVHAHRAGILTATTIMATGAAFDHAARLARDDAVAAAFDNRLDRAARVSQGGSAHVIGRALVFGKWRQLGQQARAGLHQAYLKLYLSGLTREDCRSAAGKLDAHLSGATRGRGAAHRRRRPGAGPRSRVKEQVSRAR